jgi:hypothetical protein
MYLSIHLSMYPSIYLSHALLASHRTIGTPSVSHRIDIGEDT